jgi:hypothetical protein
MSPALLRRLAITGLLIAAALAMWLVRRSHSSRSDLAGVDVPKVQGTTRAMGRPLVGIRAAGADPAEPPLQWIREGADVIPPTSPSPLHALIADDESLEELMGLLEWALPLGQRGESGLEMAQCAARFEPDLESPCGWEIEAVLRRHSDDTGEIAYARAVFTAGHEQPACRALASCSTGVWARRAQVPMPQRLGDELQFSQGGRNSFWTGDSGSDAPTYYRNALTRSHRSFEELSAVPHDPDQISPASVGWNLSFYQHRIDEFECMIDILEERPEACKT